MSRAIHELLTVIWLRVKVPVLSVASSVSWTSGQQSGKIEVAKKELLSL